MDSGIAQVARPGENIETRHDNDNNSYVAKKYGMARKKERELVHVRSGLADARFAYGRRNAINALMRRRFGGPCLTDDAELLAELFIPFIVEAAVFHKEVDRSRRCPEAEAFRYLSSALPFWTKAHPEMLRTLVADTVAKRQAAVETHDPARGRHVQWLPTMPELVAALRPTREEARDLRGWSCIDPVTAEERLEADRLRKRASRVAKGATPRGESISARKPWVALGISRAKWYRLKKPIAPEIRETVSSEPYLLEEYGADVSVSPPEVQLHAVADNDNQPSTVEPPPDDWDWRSEYAFIGKVVGVFPEELAQLQAEFAGLDIMAILPNLDAEIAAQGWEAAEAGAVLWDLLRVRHVEMRQAA